MKRIICMLLVIAMMSFSVLVLAEEEKSVNRDEIPVLSNGIGLDKLGILKGTENGFELGREVTRAEALAFISRTLAMDINESDPHFSDMEGHWAEGIVSYFYEEGYVDGISETEFAPERSVTGKEFIKILLSAMGYSDITLENALEKGIEYMVITNNFTKSVVAEDCALLRSDVLRIVHSALTAKCADGAIAYEKHIEKGSLKAEDFDGVLWSGTPEAEEASFADKFYNNIESDKSYMVSPFSVKMALLLLANGAEGEAKKEILSILNIENLDAYNEKAKTLVEKYANSKSFTLNVANSLWLNKDNTDQNFSDDYANKMELYYDAEVKSVNGKNAVNEVNSWVDKKTEGKITSLIDNSNFWSLLVNAVYFKACWEQEFNTGSTRNDIFHGKAGDREEAFMSKTGYMRAFANDGLKILEIPYKNRVVEHDDNGGYKGSYTENIDISMYVLMGDERITDADALIRTENLESTYVALYIPKFESETSLGLNEILKALGMNVSFTGSADFTKMYDTGNMCVTDTIHKTYIKVDEKGTEAAAVTGVAMGATSAMRPTPVEFKFDKPFTYVIKDNTSGEVLFMGEFK